MKKFINILEIMNDLDELKKKVYLDSPEVFVDFSDKIESSTFDEMILFFATKYNYPSIVKFILNNELVNLDSASKNNQFKTIKEHILAASSQFNSDEINDFISNFKKSTNDETNTESDTKEEEKVEEEVDNSFEAALEKGLENFIKTFEDKLSNLCEQIDEACNELDKEVPSTDEEPTPNKENPSNYQPSFICPNCNCNILEEGYSVLEKVGYKYSKDENKILKTSCEQTNSVICSKCNYTIEQLNPSFLENICTVQNCEGCGKDLTTVGIVAKSKTEYDKDSKMFISAKKSYHCSECDHELSEYQTNYFMLD